MARQTAAQQKAKVAQKRQCGSCGEVFTGTTCPNCEEKANIYPINADGLPMADVADVVGATHSLPIRLQRSPEFDPDFELEEATRRQMKDVLQEAQLDKVRAAAAVQAAKRLRAEKELEATEKGFMSPEQGEQQQEDQSGFASMSPGIFLQALGGWDPEQREQFLNQLASNPMLALNLSMMMNPGKAGSTNPMGMMNPMAMMGQMMQPPAEQAPPVDAATMVTAMISGMQSLKEMSGGDGNNSAQLERVLDKMDEMRKETEDLKLKLIEEKNNQPGITQDEVRIIIADALSRNSEQRANIQEGVAVLNDLKSLKSGMVELGLMQEVKQGDDKPSIEDRELDHKIKMDEKREAREHEVRMEEERSQQAVAESRGLLINGLFAAGRNDHNEDADESNIEESPIDVVKADIPRTQAVIS